MPSLYIMSLFERQKEKYWGRICEARQELAQFEEHLGALVGTEVAAAVRAHIHPPWRSLLRGGKMPEMPAEGQAALAEAQRLVKQENLVTRHLHSPICCYMERLDPPYVLWCYGITWDDMENLREDGKVALKYALRILEILLTEQPKFPTRREIKAFDIAPETLDGWEKLFERKRRRLVRFLRMAARLEEDLIWGIF
jgi:hypothetical protein